MDQFKIPDLSQISLPHNPPLAVRVAKEQGELTRRMLSGEALYFAMMKAVQDLVGRAPAEHDVLIQALGIFVTNVGFIEPHAFVFKGYDHDSHETSVVAHYSQVVCRVVYAKKRGPDKIITGFSREQPSA